MRKSLVAKKMYIVKNYKSNLFIVGKSMKNNLQLLTDLQFF